MWSLRSTSLGNCDGCYKSNGEGKTRIVILVYNLENGCYRWGFWKHFAPRITVISMVNTLITGAAVLPSIGRVIEGGSISKTWQFLTFPAVLGCGAELFGCFVHCNVLLSRSMVLEFTRSNDFDLEFQTIIGLSWVDNEDKVFESVPHYPSKWCIVL